MSKLKQLFTSLKFIVFVVFLTGLALAIGFISIEKPVVNKIATQNSNNRNFATPASNNSNVVATHSSISPDVKVWVNTNSGVYHCPNTRWYGNTKHGKFMTQREAQSKGYRPAGVMVCG